jgi:IS30 family transposase
VVEMSGELSNQEISLRIRQLHAVVQEQHTSGVVPVVVATHAPRRRQHRLSADRVCALLAGYESGVPVPVLAKQFTIHKSTVLNHVNRSNTKRRYPVLYADQVAEPARLYEAGQSLRAIGIQLGRHPATVRRALIKAGVQIRHRRGKTP